MVRKTATAAKTGPSGKAKIKERKIFVLDTSVILYDHRAIENFDEHDVIIPIPVLEELDQFKKGNDIINFEAREFIRFLDKMAGQHLLHDWIEINGPNKGKFKVLMDERSDLDAEVIFREKNADHRILNAALHMSHTCPDQKVTLVSKDINLRLKAKSLNIQAEDYLTGKIKDLDTLYTGISKIDGLSSEVINKLYAEGFVAPGEVMEGTPNDNQYFILRNGKNSVLAYYNPVENRIERLNKTTAYGIAPRNAEQTFALHAVMNPAVKLVTLMGVAGTGKTLLALAGAIEARRDYRQIYLARPVVPLSNRDLGFLPGDIGAKLGPYMEPLWDNLKFIQSQFEERSKQFQKLKELVDNEKITITPLAYIRGRSLAKIFFIVDEAQNLTPHEVKTIITRAGEDTKIIFTGDIRQIDTPYLDAQSNGLSYLIDRIKSHPLYAHVTLAKGERSDLANLANDML
ncbi:MAG: PhoH family protein [Bacteroidia bacterium]|nr:PhoH family protein [Bacteroidia bacterium]